MPLYGSLAHVQKMIRATDVSDPGTDVDNRLTEIQAAVSLLLEEKCQRTWGDTNPGVPEVDTSELHWVGQGDTLVLDRPARSITSLTYGGTVVGSTMTGGTVVLASSLYYPIVDRNGLILAVGTSATNIWWWNWAYITPSDPRSGKVAVLVTGTFGDVSGDVTVPADVTYAAEVLITEFLKLENTSSAGFIGPEGTVQPRDPWRHPAVRDVIDKYAVRTASLAV